MNSNERKPWTFCETPKEKCTMNYCDENGCQNRKRNLVDDADVVKNTVDLGSVSGTLETDTFILRKMTGKDPLNRKNVIWMENKEGEGTGIDLDILFKEKM